MMEHDDAELNLHLFANHLKVRENRQYKRDTLVNDIS